MAALKLPIVVLVLGLMMVFSQSEIEVLAADEISYIGAVAEYHPVTDGADGTIISMKNAENYVTMIKTASRFNADILVFPEDSLTAGLTHSDTDRTLYPSYSSVIPEPGTDTPCDNNSTVVIEALRLVSCAAKLYSIYVVVNLHEMVNCNGGETTSRPCPRDGYFFYNTNVAFDRTGGIVSKYRKFNLFAEPGINVTSTPENATFTTDFNVKFGHIVCFDIYFATPALTLVADYNVNDVIHPARWFSELPYVTALQTQSAWAFANDVNLLSAGYNMPKTANGGSGIHAGSAGNLVKLWSENSTNALLVARIPKVVNGSRAYVKSANYPMVYEFTNAEIDTLVNATGPDDRKDLFADNLAPYKTKELVMSRGTTTTDLELCDREFCCSFFVNRTISADIIENKNARYYRHRLAVFNGVRSFAGSVTAGVQVCSLISCTNDSLTSCGLRFPPGDPVAQPTLFNGISISGKFSTDSTSTMQMANTLTSSMLPLNSSDFTFTKRTIAGTNLTMINFSLTTVNRDLFTFAIYGRNFSADGLPVTESSSVALPTSSVAMTTVLAATFTPLLMSRH